VTASFGAVALNDRESRCWGCRCAGMSDDLGQFIERFD
jgi:hypothetical protein